MAYEHVCMGPVVNEDPYYAVKVGRTTGIFRTWKECQESIKGYKGALFKRFDTEKEAIEYLAEEPKKDYNGFSGVTAYTDGSYNPDSDLCGYGVYLENGDEKTVLYGSFKQTECGRNVEGEVMAGLVAAEYVFNNYTDKELVICHDYMGVGAWADHSWNANKEYNKRYAENIAELRKEGLKVHFEHVDAHTGLTGNEIADRLSKYASGLPLGRKDKKILSYVKDAKNFPKEAIREEVER